MQAVIIILERNLKDVKPGETPLFSITPSKRLLALLKVTSTKYSQVSKTREVVEKWVVFLVDTGSPATFFNDATYTAMQFGGENAAVGNVAGVLFPRPQRSTNHFKDINLLGTDVLEKGTLIVDYPVGNFTWETGFIQSISDKHNATTQSISDKYNATIQSISDKHNATIQSYESLLLAAVVIILGQFAIIMRK